MDLNLSKNQNQQENQELQPTRSPNLLYSVTSNPFAPIIEKRHAQIATVAKVLVILVQLIFGAFIAINSKVAADISIAEKQVKELETKLIAKREQSKQVQNVIDKIEKLKKLKVSTPKLTDDVDGLMRFAPDPTIITQAYIRPSTVQISTDTVKPLEVSALISAYLEKGLASEVTIKTANMSKATGRFISTLEIKLK